MTKQLIYRNPLHVLFVMQEHGAVFQVSRHGKIYKIEVIFSANEFGAWNAVIEFDEKFNQTIALSSVEEFYVHPDSLPLYELQIGDWYSFIESQESPGFPEEINVKDYAYKGEPLFGRGGKIIMRNGKHFLWPDEIREVAG